MDYDKKSPFVPLILRLTPDTLEDALLPLEPIKPRYDSLDEYFAANIPLVLDDARASIQQGMCKRNVKESKLWLSKDARPPRYDDNPFMVLNFNGILNIDDDGCPVSNVVLLEFGTMRCLALANTNVEDNSVWVKAMFLTLSDLYYSDESAFARGAKWEARYITSVLTHERMYNACNRLNRLHSARLIPESIIHQIASGSSFGVPDVPMHGSCGGDGSVIGIDNTNPCQTHAVVSFCGMPDGQIMMMEGPPGTGKTTTVNSILTNMVSRDIRTLVCAPSNKAVQVLAERFLANNPTVAVMLVGVQSKIPASLKDISYYDFIPSIRRQLSSIEKAVENMNLDPKKMDERVCVTLSAKAEDIYKWIRAKLAKYSLLQPQMDSLLCTSPLDFSANSLLAHTDNILFLIKLISENGLLNNSKVIFCTLSSSGSKVVSDMVNPVEVLIVDEAGQSVEAETLIAFQTQPGKVLLVGDIKQLPATVISQPAKDNNYSWSMMQRLQEECSQPHAMLTEQYRMHPAICDFPSRRYYDGRLTNADAVVVVARRETIPPRAFYNVKHVEEKIGLSLGNHGEVEHVSHIVNKLRSLHPKKSIGVITFYAAQKQLLIQKLGKHDDLVKIGTVDGFQGEESDIIILSFVRCNSPGVTGFVQDFRRLNVAITRARHSLIMLGCATTLSKSKDSQLAALVADCRDKGALLDTSALRQSFPPSRAKVNVAPSTRPWDAVPISTSTDTSDTNEQEEGFKKVSAFNMTDADFPSTLSTSSTSSTVAVASSAMAWTAVASASASGDKNSVRSGNKDRPGDKDRSGNKDIVSSALPPAAKQANHSSDKPAAWASMARKSAVAISGQSGTVSGQSRTAVSVNQGLGVGGLQLLPGRKNKRDKKGKAESAAAGGDKGEMGLIKGGDVTEMALTEQEQPNWSCTACTFENFWALRECEMCGQTK